MRPSLAVALPVTHDVSIFCKFERSVVFSRSAIVIAIPSVVCLSVTHRQTDDRRNCDVTRMSFTQTVELFRSIFTARCICIARTMPWQGVCSSIRLSVRHTPVFCRNG